MLHPLKIIISLSFLLSVTYCETIDLKIQPDYLITNEKSSVNYTTCEVDEDGAHDYDDNIDPKEGGCHHTHYQDWDSIADEFPGVRPCCPFHGHIFSVEKCQGKDKDGNEATFKKVDACIKVSEGQTYESVGTTLTCDGQNQTIVKGEI